MNRGIVKTLSLCAFLFVLLLAGEAPAQGLPSAILDQIGVDQNLNQQIPLDLVFKNEHGREVRLGDYFGQKPVVLTLVYYECPMLCTEILNGLLRTLKALSFNVGEEFQVVTVSFDPHETPVLALAKKRMVIDAYGRPGAESGWHFLTGDEGSIRQLTEAVGFRYVYLAGEDQFAHPSAIVILTPTGKVSRYFYGIDYPPRDVRLGLVEAAENRIGSAVDQVLLYCFHYDPTTGKYGVVIMNIIRLAGLATVLALGGFMLTNLMRDRRQSRLAGEATGRTKA